MKVKHFLPTVKPMFIFSVIGTVTGLNACKGPSDKVDIKPNILLIVADDMGIELGCYGDSIARTPKLDQFATENIRFVNAYVTQSSCSPSRSSILTGLYPHQNGQFGLSHRGISMSEEYSNVVSILKDADYYTAVMGKIHVNPLSAFPFDYKVGGMDYETPGLVNDKAKVLTLDGEESLLHVTFSQRPDKMADSASSVFVNSGGRPFFLMANYFDPHEPFYNQIDGLPSTPLKADEVRQLPFFRNPEAPEKIAGYYNGVSRFDAGLELIFNKLKESGKYDNTLILIIGDNGAPLSGGKLSCFERGLKVPFLMKLPGKSTPMEIAAYVSMTDILPTIIELTGLSLPGEIAGKSLIPLINDNNIEWRSYIAGEFNQHQPEYLFPQRAIRKDSCKLIMSYFTDLYASLVPENVSGNNIYDPKDRRGNAIRKIISYSHEPQLQLYNLNKDPYEKLNLAYDPEYSECLEMMLGTLGKWQIETRDPLIDSLKYQDYIEAIQQNIKDAFSDTPGQPAETYKSFVLHKF